MSDLNGQALPRDHGERVELVLHQTHTRYFRGVSQCDRTGHGVDFHNPMEELIAREEEAERDVALESLDLAQRTLDLHVLPEPLVAQIREIAFDHFRQFEEAFLEWLFNGGPHPLDVTKRLFCYAKHKRASLVYNMSFRDLGDLFGESHAAVHARSKALFGETPAGWRKGRGARQKMAESQQGNTNRIGGKKVRRRKSK